MAVVAHRGSAADAPENTLAAVRLALEHGADVVETDVKRTRDGVLVVLHDESLARTTDVRDVFPEREPWWIGDLTLEEVRRLDAGSWFGPAFTGEQVPTLREWMDAVGDAGMLIEAKEPHLHPGIEHELDAELRAVPPLAEGLAEGRLVVQSSNRDWLRAFHDLAPDVPLALVHHGVPDEDLLAQDSEWLDALNPALRNTTPELVTECTRSAWPRASGPSTTRPTWPRPSRGESTASSPTTRTSPAASSPPPADPGRTAR